MALSTSSMADSTTAIAMLSAKNGQITFQAGASATNMLYDCLDHWQITKKTHFFWKRWIRYILNLEYLWITSTWKLVDDHLLCIHIIIDIIILGMISTMCHQYIHESYPQKIMWTLSIHQLRHQPMWLSGCLDHFGSLLLGLPCNDGQNEHLNFFWNSPRKKKKHKQLVKIIPNLLVVKI